MGIPKCPKGKGENLKGCIVDVVDNYIEPNQYTSFTGDGVYAKTGVGPLLDQHYQRKGFFLWDLMHLSAVQDNAMRNENKEWSKQFQWLCDMTITIRKSVTFVQWGMEWSHFFKVSQTLKEEGYENFKVKRPLNFSETKFANWAQKVYSTFRDIFRALVVTLSEVKEDNWQGDNHPKKKANTADELEGSIYNYTFLLSLSCMVDVYSVYSRITNILQIVNILPFNRYDRFHQNVAKYLEMMTSVELADCPCSMFCDPSDDYKVDETFGEDGKLVPCKGIMEEVCNWPVFHSDVREVFSKGTYFGVAMGLVNKEGKY